MDRPTASTLTGKGRKQFIAYFETLADEQLIAAYQEECAVKRWDEARLAKQEMRERGLAK
jgi:hypothetical protein